MAKTVIANGVDKNAKKQQISKAKQNNTNASKLKKNLKLTIEETTDEIPNKDVASNPKMGLLRHQTTLYYHTREAAVAHYDEILKNTKNHDIRDIVCSAASLDTTMLKVYVGPKVLTDKEKEKLLMITKARSVKSASDHFPILNKLLLLKFDDAAVAKQVMDKGRIMFRGFKLVLTYAEHREDTNENKKEVKAQEEVAMEMDAEDDDLDIELEDEEEDEDDDDDEDEDDDDEDE